jgi:putative flavoprotein involved in K+ transport
MTMPELVTHFDRYARSFDAPVLEHTPVRSVTIDGDGFDVRAGTYAWHTHSVVVATGWTDRPHVPDFSTQLPARVLQLTSAQYRSPDQIAGRSVLVVGASASGTQIASELAEAGRDVTLAVGRHRRVPRRYRGRDIMWWFERLGTLDRAPKDDRERRVLLREPSLQLSAADVLDLGSLAGQGITVAGRVANVADDRIWFADDLQATMTESDVRLRSLLSSIDELAGGLGVTTAATPIRPISVDPAPPRLHAGVGGVDAVIWATGFRRAYPWLHVPVLDGSGEIIHDHGITPVPGLFTAGMRFQSGRRSTFIDGARIDAPTIASAIEHRAEQRRAA